METKKGYVKDVLPIGSGINYIKTEDFAIVNSYCTKETNVQIIQSMKNLGWDLKDKSFFDLLFEKSK